MKYEAGQPAATAVIKEGNPETKKYLIEYHLREGAKPEELGGPQERLNTPVDMPPAAGRY